MAALLLASPAGVMAKTYELSFATHVPAKAAPYHAAFEPWAKELEKRTKGQVKIKFYLSQTLVKARDSYDAVKNGIADISWVAFSWTPGRFPLSSVMELPYLSPDTFTGAYALTGLYNKFPQMSDEIKDVHLMWLWVTLPYEVHTNKPIKKLEDIKGMKLATQPGARAAVEGLGAVPVTMPTPQIYQTVEKGVADGAALAWGAFKAYKIYEVTKYHVNPHLSGLPYCIIMNKNTWNKIPKDLQKIITDLNKEMMPKMHCQAVSDEMVQGIKIVKDRGHEITELSAEERARWVATGKPAWDKWVKDVEAKGLPGKAILEETLRLIEKNR
jgi:TRAP-type C4-dicarboxylate transport system substrate-binding protein